MQITQVRSGPHTKNIDKCGGGRDHEPAFRYCLVFNCADIKLVIENYSWKDKYIKSSKNLSEELFIPDKHIFAVQELNSKKGTPQNDKAIFNSIVTAMKSQNYEIASLEKRKKEESVYATGSEKK